MDDAGNAADKNHKVDANMTGIIAARQRVWDEYMNGAEVDHPKASTTKPSGRFADPMAAIRIGESGR